ncbi:hypothetical protein BAOM_1402 [Peribacillus asahii]|uniref:Uncharacterized protein n=1 Tax=Peribacillus asahii TaxID=228899 RepID=A0A3Q9RLL8_9BACI|nr:hypothetical protein [Peribacillus asahii]AZV42012.1 hypothetical protein BAOM_1402 [Peribacillus asahii]
MGFFQKLKAVFTSDSNSHSASKNGDMIKVSTQTPTMNKQVFNQNKINLEEGILRLEEAKCPYCQHQLEKPPSRKRKCLSCKNDMYVRTLPYIDEKDKIRVLVTEEKADKIDITWAKINGTYNDMMKERKQYEQMKQELYRAWGNEPSESDINWHLMINKRIEHYNNQQWGLYRNTTLSMAEHLYKLKKYELAFIMYLEVLYIDVNGPNNAGKINGRYEFEVRANFMPFNPKDKGNTFVAPAILKRVNFIRTSKHPIDSEKIKELFMYQCEQVHHSLNLPITPQEAWDKLKDEITDNKNNNEIL